MIYPSPLAPLPVGEGKAKKESHYRLSLMNGEEMFYLAESIERLERCGWSSRHDFMHMMKSVKSKADDIIRKEFSSGEYNGISERESP